MEKTKKIKLFIGILYLIIITIFLYFFFSKFSLQEITSYEFIKNNKNYFFEIKKANFLLLSICFVGFAILWVFAAGFVAPLAIFAGFIFGKWIGLIYTVFGMSLGATLLYIFANYFLKKIIEDKFLNKYKNLEYKFKKSEFLYLLLYRFIGGIPFAISNILPCIFNVKILNFFLATIIGTIPQVFLIVSMGSGLEKIIENNPEAPSLIELINSPGIYIPLLVFACLVIVTIFLRKFFYKN